MNKYLKEFLHRGLMFSGFGPIIAAIVFLILSYTVDDFSITGGEWFCAIVTTYILAFVQAGASVFNQIDNWPIMKSLFCHFGVLYLAYTGCYLLNSWIPFKLSVIAIFTAIFVVVYLCVWVTVYLCVRASAKKLSQNLI